MAPERYTQWGGTGERKVDGLALYDDIHMTAARFHSTVDATLCVTETLK